MFIYRIGEVYVTDLEQYFSELAESTGAIPTLVSEEPYSPTYNIRRSYYTFDVHAGPSGNFIVDRICI